MKFSRIIKSIRQAIGQRISANEQPDFESVFVRSGGSGLLVARSNSEQGLADLIAKKLAEPQCPFLPHVAWPANDNPRLAADKIIDLSFELASEPEVRFTDRVDWQFNPTQDPRRRWTRDLHRHSWLVCLTEAFRQTGDERYAAHAGVLVLDWIAQNPPPAEKDEQNVAWTLMGVGIRAMIWPDALRVLSEHSDFRSDVAPTMLLSMHDHAAFLCRYETHFNHLLRETNGLLHLALRFPEFEAASEWRRESVERLQRELVNQVQPDGSHVELSLAYQWMVVEELECTKALCSLGVGQQDMDELKQAVVAALERLYDYLVAMVTPGFTWSQLKEGFYPAQQDLRAMLLKASSENSSQEMLWVATCGERGVAPSTTSAHFGDAGVSVFRSHWGTKAHMLNFLTGAFGGAHGHEDALSIEVWAHGSPFIVDPGTSSYNAKDPYRHYFTSTNAHNSVTVDGLSQVRRWAKPGWWTNANSDHSKLEDTAGDFQWVRGRYADRYAKYTGMTGRYGAARKGVVHERCVVWVRKTYWVLIDSLSAPEPAAYERLFQCAKDVGVETVPGGVWLSYSTAQSQQSNEGLYVVSADSGVTRFNVQSGSTDPIAGWVADGGRNNRDPASQISVTQDLARSVRLVTILMPAKNISSTSVSAPSVAVEAAESAEDCVLIEYQLADNRVTDRLVLDSEGRPVSLN